MFMFSRDSHRKNQTGRKSEKSFFFFYFLRPSTFYYMSQFTLLCHIKIATKGIAKDCVELLKVNLDICSLSVEVNLKLKKSRVLAVDMTKNVQASIFTFFYCNQ